MQKRKGTHVVEVVEHLLDSQMRSAQDKKHDEILEALGDFARKYGIPAEAGPVNALARLLRNKGTEINRQVRSMSDALLLKEEKDLEFELEQLRTALSPIEARFHQVKTKNAFVYTVLRPFSPKFADRWFEERTDINVESLRGVVEQLKRAEISNVLELSEWAEQVSMLFEHLVVFRGDNAEDYYSRPAGTISSKSSRTYLQAWLAFTEKSKHQIWNLLSGEGNASRATNTKPGVLDEEEMGFDQAAPRSRESTPANSSSSSKTQQDSFSLMMAPPREKSETSFLRASPRSSKPRIDAVEMSRLKENSASWIKIFIESKIDSTAQATRKWESQADFVQTLQKWLDTLPLIWGPAADQFLAKVSVKTATGESDLTLPSLTVKDAADRLTKAVEMQQD